MKRKNHLSRMYFEIDKQVSPECFCFFLPQLTNQKYFLQNIYKLPSLASKHQTVGSNVTNSLYILIYIYIDLHTSI